MEIPGQDFIPECSKHKLGKSCKAFTAFEMVACFFVITLLIGLPALRVKVIQDEARIIKVKADLKAMAVAFQFYKRDHGGVWPRNLDDDFAHYQVKWLIEMPKDPFNNHDNYAYYRNPRGHYILWSLGVKGDGRIISFDQGEGVQVSGGIICMTDYDPGRDAGCMVF
ncbi:MAG: hypothetical protein HQL21_00700 [Candidatus Omnitrophica bacterium]|nr:hypothetical protein [Candidatus Omnitrophota bacterium]